jgi:long-chain acyl-CoA synthetase
VPAGQQGEILLKGPMITRGYHNLPDETAAALTRDGFFRTGDLGRIDADGFLHITGRKKDLIIVAGEKASPREIEEVLMSHPAVAEAAVVGKRDDVRGEVVVSFVIIREGQSVEADELREHCRRAGLAQWKVPREIHVVPDLPRSPTGKVLKRALVQP